MEDTKFKKTTLSDDALIYQKSKDTVTKEEIKNLPLRQRLGYFRDYYLKIVIVTILAVVLIISVLNTTIFNRSESELAISFLNGAIPTGTEEMDSFFEEYIGLKNKNDFIRSETYALDNYQMDMAYRTKLMAGAIDLIICPYDDYVEQAEQGMFCDLRDLLPQAMCEQLSDLLIENRVEETDGMGEVISYTEPLPMGIDLSDSSFYKKYGGIDEHPVLCAAGNVHNKENALLAIACFTGIDPPLEPETAD